MIRESQCLVSSSKKSRERKILLTVSIKYDIHYEVFPILALYNCRAELLKFTKEMQHVPLKIWKTRIFFKLNTNL